MQEHSMKNNEKTLFVFEGAKTENSYIEKLENNFLGPRNAIKCVYGAEIYQLYSIMKNDNPFPEDIVSLLKERPSTNNAEVLKDYDRNSFAYIYLFFDYDAHARFANDDKIKEMLSFFDNETEEGKLYISYPMAEAIRHYEDMDSFKNLTVKCKKKNCPFIDECEDKDCLNEPHYKHLSVTGKLQLWDTNSYTKNVWQELITAHLKKANLLVNDVFVLPFLPITQSSIFEKQLEKHINKKCPEVAVLSALPLYVFDYYGAIKTIKKICE